MRIRVTCWGRALLSSGWCRKQLPLSNSINPTPHLQLGLTRQPKSNPFVFNRVHLGPLTPPPYSHFSLPLSRSPQTLDPLFFFVETDVVAVMSWTKATFHTNSSICFFKLFKHFISHRFFIFNRYLGIHFHFSPSCRFF